jgi:uncharacterized membrane protein
MLNPLRNEVTTKKAMKKIYCSVLGLALLTNCAHDDNSDDISLRLKDELLFQNITYEGNIKALVKTNCLACHSNPPTDGATIPLNTFEAVKNAVEKKDLIMRINSSTNAMPPDGLMPKDARRMFDAWVTQGLKEN